jgi:proline racemase
MALLHARGQLAVGEPFLHLSILDTEFACAIEGVAQVGASDAVVTRVSGRAWLTGVSYYGTDPEDPFPEGYRLNDSWPTQIQAAE